VSAPANLLDALKTLQDYVLGVSSIELPPRPGHYVTEDPPLSCTCLATMFGLNWNGTFDQSDNGEGFFIDPAARNPFETRDKNLVGASLPREVMLSTFGISDDWRSKSITEVWRENAAKVQDTQGKALVTYKIVIAGQPVPIKGWLFDKRRVG